MLNPENRLSNNFLVFIISIIFYSCSDDYENKREYYNESFETIKNASSHAEVLAAASDTIKHWVDLELTYFYKFSHKVSWAKYKIDTWILFNSKVDRCLINLLVQDIANETQDDIYYVIGERQQGKWWFYQGPDLVILQENYTDDLSIKALPFSTLSEIARRNTLGWYYIEKPAGTCLKKLFSEGYDSYKKCSEEKYMINDEYFEDEFGYLPDFESRQKDYRERFLKNKFFSDSVELNPPTGASVPLVPQ